MDEGSITLLTGYGIGVGTGVVLVILGTLWGAWLAGRFER